MPTCPPLTVPQILAWCDVFHARTGDWPRTSTADCAEPPTGENWRRLDNALRLGLRTLPGGSSLAQLLDEHRGVRNKQDLPPLTHEAILTWADQHRERSGSWPNEDSGPVLTAPGEVWYNVNAALREGLRTLPGGETLALLIAQKRGVRNKASTPPLTVERILAWGDAWYAARGQWPKHDDGPIPDAPEETWDAVEAALYNGCRGLKGGSSLYALLKRYRRIPGRRSRLAPFQTSRGRKARPRGKHPDVGQRRRALELREQGLLHKEIGRELGVSNQRAHQLVQTSEQATPLPPAVPRPWTEAEDALVLTLPAGEAATRTGRTRDAVSYRRRVLSRTNGQPVR
jgi:hypothetical protein